MSRDLEKERQWRKRLQAWRDSGLTVAQFCDREDLNDHNFRSWQATIKQRDEEQFQKIMSKKQLDQPAAFVPVTLVKEPKQAAHMPASIQPKGKEPASFAQQLAMEILTPTGHIFRIYGNTDPGLLRVILASLGRQEC